MPECSPNIVLAQGRHTPAGPHLAQRILSGQVFRGNSAEFMITNARRYGDLVYFRVAGRDVFQCNHPELVHEMLVRDAPRQHRGIVMQRARFVLGDGMLTSEEPLHMRQRRLSQPAFHRDRIAGYGEVIGRYALAMTGRWHDGSTRDLHADMLLLALRIVGKCLFDTEVDTEVKRVAAAVDAFMGFLPLAFLPFPKIVLRLPLPLMRRIREGQAELTAMIDGMIQRRRADPGDRGDLLSMLIEAVDLEENTGRMSDRQVRDECLTLLLAGHETTANALSFALWLLATHPGIQDAVHAEAAAALAHRVANAADYPALPLTHAVFAEAMRLYPPVWVTARTAAQSYDFRGFPIAPGALLLAPQIVIHRDPRFYPEPERFDPGRFLDTARTSAPRPDRPRFAYFPFGAGSRQCIGEGLAWMEGVLTLATILRDWRLTPPAGASPALASRELAVLPRITLRPKDGLPLLLSRR